MGAALTLRELRGLAGLVEPSLLALDLPGIARQIPLTLQRHTQLRIGVDEGAGDAVPDRARLTARTAAVDADAKVVGALGARRLQRGGRERAVRRAREVLLEGLAVHPAGAVARAQDHARDGRLALAGTQVLRDVCHVSSSPRAEAAWGPAPRADARGQRRSSACSAGRARGGCGAACP